MLKVCFVVSEFPRLSESFVMNQAVGAAQRGFDVSVITDYIRDAEPIGPTAEPLTTLLHTVGRRWRRTSATPALLEMTRGRLHNAVLKASDWISDSQFNQFDLLIAHFGPIGVRLARSRRQARFDRPFITSFHGYDVARPMHAGTLQRLYGPLFATGEMLLPVSHHFSGALLAAGASPHAVRVHRMGVDCRAIRFAARAPLAGRWRVLTVSRLVEKKGTDYALRAVAGLVARRPDLQVRYDIVGDGPLRAELKQCAARLGLLGVVKFWGALPHREVAERLDDADVFLLPSVTAHDGDMEGVPVVLMEAMAAGVPVVSSLHSGVGELVADGTSGLLAPERDVAGLVERLQWMVDNQRAAAALARQARGIVERHYNQCTLDDAFAELIETRVEEWRGTARRRHAAGP